MPTPQRSAFNILADSIQLDRSAVDISTVGSKNDKTTMAVTNVSNSLEQLGGESSSGMPVPNAVGSIDSYYRKMYEFFSSQIAELALREGLNSPYFTADDATKFMDDVAPLRYRPLRDGDNSTPAKLTKNMEGVLANNAEIMQQVHKTDRILAIASAQLNSDGKRISSAFYVENTGDGSIVKSGNAPGTSSSKLQGFDMSSSAATQVVFFATPFIDTTGSYQKESQQYNAVTCGKHKTSVPVLAPHRPFSDGDSSTIFDMRNIAREGSGTSVTLNLQGQIAGQRKDYIEWFAGGGNDKAVIGSRLTYVNGGEGSMDVADYGLTFNLDNVGVAKGKIEAITTGAGNWAVKKSGTGTFQDLVMKSTTSKVGKYTTKTTYFYTTEAASRTFSNYVDVLESVEAVSGTSASDLFVAGAQKQFMLGQGGNDSFRNVFNDIVIAGDGADSVFGGLANDAGNEAAVGSYVEGNAGNDLIILQDGANTLIGGSGSDTIQGGIGADVLYDSEGMNALFGNDGDDFLLGSLAAVRAGSSYDGGAGSDVFTAQLIKDTGIVASLSVGTDALGNVFTAAGVRVSGQSSGAALVGIEGVEGTNNADVVTGDGAANTLSGLAGNDQLYGLDGEDYLHGGAGADSLFGGNDHDLLVGGEGDDVLVGGFGPDTFGFEGAFGNDTIIATDADVGEYTDENDLLLFNDVSFSDLVFMDVRRNDQQASGGDLKIAVVNRSEPGTISRSVTVKGFDTETTTAAGIVVAANAGNGQRAMITAAAIVALAAEMANAGMTTNGSVTGSLDQLPTLVSDYWILQQAA